MREAGLWGVGDNKERFTSFLAENKERFKDKEVRGREVADFLQGMAQGEQRRRADARADARARLGDTREPWWQTAIRIPLIPAEWFGKMKNVPLYAAAETLGRFSKKTADTLVADGGGGYVRMGGDDALTAAGHAAAGTGAQIGLLKGSAPLFGWLGKKFLAAPFMQKVMESKAGPVLREAGWLAEKSHAANIPALTTMMLGQSLLDEGAGQTPRRLGENQRQRHARCRPHHTRPYRRRRLEMGKTQQVHQKQRAHRKLLRIFMGPGKHPAKPHAVNLLVREKPAHQEIPCHDNHTRQASRVAHLRACHPTFLHDPQ